MSEQWDVGRALALAALFRLLQGAGRACAAPFLPLYLRLLGLPAPLVGAAAGARHLAALAVPLCCPRGRGRRRLLLLVGAALGSAGASLLLTLVPAAGDAGPPACDRGRQLGPPGPAPAALPSGLLSTLPTAVPTTLPSSVPTTMPSSVPTTMSSSVPTTVPSPVPGPVPTTLPPTVPIPVPSPGTSSSTALSSSALPDTRAEPKETGRAPADVVAASRKPALGTSASQGFLGTAGAQENGRGAGEGDAKGNGSLDGPSGWTVKAVDQETQQPERLASYGAPFPGLEKETLGSAATDLADNAEQSLYAAGSDGPPLFKTTLPTAGDVSVSENRPHTQAVNFEAMQSIFQDREQQVFLLVLGAVVLWELLAASLEWTVDEAVYEYLELVDGTDRYGRLWVWSSLGGAAGACGVAVLVEQLPCSLGRSIPRLAAHFYSFSILVMLSLLVSVSFPNHSPSKSPRAPGMARALSLLWGDGRALLFAGTLFVVGAASSAGHNFLLWQLQDQGGSELLMGICVAVGLLAELGLCPFKKQLLRPFPSSRVVPLSLGLLAAQLLCFSLLRAPWAVLPVQLLAASSRALCWLLEGTVRDTATPGTERALLALLGLCWPGGAGLGSLLGGFVLHSFGLPLLFRGSCVVLLLWLLFFVIVQSRLPRQRKINYSRLLAADCSDGSDSEEENEKDWLVKAMRDESFNRNWIQQHGIN